MRFDYPREWYVWMRSFARGHETVTIANVDMFPIPKGALPDGLTKIDFSSSPSGLIPTVEPPVEPDQVIHINGIDFRLTRFEEAGAIWLLVGHTITGGRLYILSARFASESAPDSSEAERIFASWTAKAPSPQS